jgi:hypothetical protein
MGGAGIVMEPARPHAPVMEPARPRGGGDRRGNAILERPEGRLSPISEKGRDRVERQCQNDSVEAKGQHAVGEDEGAEIA